MAIIKHLEEQNNLEAMIILPNQLKNSSIGFIKKYNLPYMETDLFPYTLEDYNRILYSRIDNLKSFLACFYTKKKVCALLNKLNPAFIVTGTEAYYLDRFFLYEAKRRGIPSLCLFSVFPTKKEHMSSLNNENKVHLRALYSIIYKKILTSLGIPLQNISVPSKGDATKVCVWSEHQKVVFKERGGVSEKLVITGSPMHDLIFQKNMKKFDRIKNKVGELLNINGNKEIILFATQPLFKDRVCTYEEQRMLTELIVRAVSNFDEYVLVIKLHPRESLEEYAYLEKHPLKNRFRVVEDKDVDLYDLIQASRIVITQWSTVGLDAMLFGKDVTTVNMLGPKDPLGYAESGAAIGVYKEDDLVHAIENALYNEEVRRKLAEARKKFIYEHAYKQDGKASKRVVDLVMQMIKESKRENDHEK
jgi:CDP-glycerol glycerophosphotransferase (TagB/SpsB family)